MHVLLPYWAERIEARLVALARRCEEGQRPLLQAIAPRLRGALRTCEQLHRALFYLGGNYLHAGQRAAGLAHVRHGGAPKTETVAVVFQRHDDLERWRRSRRREEWLRRGERFGGGGGEAGEDAWRLNARVSSIDVDDGSLGGWLPADAEESNRRGNTDASPTPAPSPWKVYAAVVLAQYPLYELNALLFLPALDAAGAEWFAALSQPARGFAVQTWTSAGAVFVTLPFAQGLLRRFGFMQSATRGETARSTALVAAAYAGTVAGFHLAQPAFAAVVERVAT